MPLADVYLCVQPFLAQPDQSLFPGAEVQRLLGTPPQQWAARLAAPQDVKAGVLGVHCAHLPAVGKDRVLVAELELPDKPQHVWLFIAVPESVPEAPAGGGDES